MPTKSTGLPMTCMSSARDLRRVGAGARQERVEVAAFQHRGQVGRVELAGGELGGADVLGRLDGGDGDADVLRRPDLRARARARADRLHRKPVGEQHVMPDLVQPAGRQLEAGRDARRCRSPARRTPRTR